MTRIPCLLFFRTQWLHIGVSSVRYIYLTLSEGILNLSGMIELGAVGVQTVLEACCRNVDVRLLYLHTGRIFAH